MQTSRRKVPGRLRMAAPLAVVGLVLVSCATPGISLFDLAPADGNTARAAAFQGQVSVACRYLDAGERVSYLTAHGHETLGLGLRQVSLVTFALTLVNGSEKQLTLDPGGIRLAVGIGPLLSPYSYAHLYMELPRGSDRQKILQDLQKTALDKPITIMPGEEVEKLLMFPRPPRVMENVSLLLAGLYAGNENAEAVLDFKAIDLER